jgi:hypothetical protein
MSVEQEPVAAVCGKEVRIYGPFPENGPKVRPLWQVKQFPHRGAALLFASEHDDRTTKRVEERRKAASEKAAQKDRVVRVVETVLAAA